MSESQASATESATPPNKEPVLGRNEPCPCGSGRKYKRCCGVDAAPKLGERKVPAWPPAGAAAPAAESPTTGTPALPAGFDPSKVDPAMAQQMMGLLQRLPRNQLQKLQSLMQRAMAGKDVSREAAEFERMLPPDLLMAARSMTGQMAGMAVPAAPTAPTGEMTAEEARDIVEAAMKEGKLEKDEASELLENAPKKSIWKRITGK